MAELADALDLGSSVNRRAGSTPVIRTNAWKLRKMGLFLMLWRAMPFIGTALFEVLTATLTAATKTARKNIE